MTTDSMQKRLYRMRDGAYAGGVCVGLADRFEMDTIVVRILAILFAVLTLGLGVLVYLALWAQLPLKSESGMPFDVRPERAESSAFGCVDCFVESDSDKMGSIPLVARVAVAAGLMILFLAVAVNLAPMLPGTQWWQFWPLGLLMVGLCLIVIPIRGRNEAAWHAAGVMLTSASASILPMSLGVLSWTTVGCAFQGLWVLVVVSVALFAVGFARELDALMLIAAFLFVLFCLMGMVFYVVPGEVEALLFHMPTGQSVRIAFL